MLRRYIGDRAFYKKVLMIAIPIIIQNGITNFVSLLDNVMVGQLDGNAMSGVAVANQLIFVFNICIFGAASGAGIFTAQFHGNRDHEGVRHTFRFKILICTLVAMLGCTIFLLWGENLLKLFMEGKEDPTDAALTMAFGQDYLGIMLLGLLPFALNYSYSSTLRESGQTVVPMVAGVSAVLTNLVGNYLLIFGKLGLPAMGVRGAAWATVLSRYVELAIVAIWTHRHSQRHPFIKGAYRSIHIPGKLLGGIARKGLPLLANEFFWAVGMAFVAQCYSTRSGALEAVSIADTISKLSSVVYMALGNSVGIIMGQLMGSGAPAREVRDTNRKTIALAVMAGTVFALLLTAAAPFFPKLYPEVSGSIQWVATTLIWACALSLPFNAYNHSSYFTLRSGGQTFVTFLFDSGFVMAVNVPLAFVLSRFTGVSIFWIYGACHCSEMLKTVLGFWMLRKGKWIRNLTQ